MAQIDRYLKTAHAHRASDLHLSAGEPMRLRVDGDLVPLNVPPVDSQKLEEILFEILTEQERQRLAENKNLDKSYSVEGLGNFRVNIFYTRRGIASVMRTIPTKIPTMSELGLPEAIEELGDLAKGLVLVTGPTGSGKSTTLAAMINMINHKHKYHILTIEDPIEFIQTSHQSLINQREIGNHCPTFGDALKYALREDPDVILVGEMRDLETISLALTAAETGHLVFGTLHTRGAASSIARIIDSFSAAQQAMIRTMLSEALVAVISQALLKKANGKGRVAAFEIMIVNHAISNLIREGKNFQIPSVIQTARKEGMILMDQHLIELLENKVITTDEAEPYMEDSTPLSRFRSTPQAHREHQVTIPPAHQQATKTSQPSVQRSIPVPSAPAQMTTPRTVSNALTTAPASFAKPALPVAKVNPPPLRPHPAAPKSPPITPISPPVIPRTPLSVAKAPAPPLTQKPLSTPEHSPPTEENSLNERSLEARILPILEQIENSIEMENRDEEVVEVLVPDDVSETRAGRKEDTSTFDIPPLHAPRAPISTTPEEAQKKRMPPPLPTAPALKRKAG